MKQMEKTVSAVIVPKRKHRNNDMRNFLISQLPYGALNDN